MGPLPDAETPRMAGLAENVGGERTPVPCADVLGIGIHAVDLTRAVSEITGAIDAGRRGYVCVTGVHGVMEAQHDPALRAALAGALLCVPDGMPTVWVGRSQGHRGMRRVFGPDLMAELCRISCTRGDRHFFYGGAPGVAGELATRLTARFPGLKVVGALTPPFRPLHEAEARNLEAELARSQPDVLWVGLGTPKQERFMAEFRQRLDVPVMIGVGAAFDFHTGRLRDAPTWMKHGGLQWLHRLAQEPHRLWKRYARNNPAFVAAICLQLAGLRKAQLGG